MAMTARDRRALILGGVGLGCLGLYLGVIEPALGWYDGVAADHERNSNRVTQVLFERQKAAYYTEQVAAWEAKAGELAPPEAYSVQVTMVREKLLAAAGPSGVNLKGSSSTTRGMWDEAAGLDKVLLHVEAEGGWENVFKFIAALYQIEGVLSVEELTLKADPKKGDKLAVTLTLSVLVQREQEDRVRWVD